MAPFPLFKLVSQIGLSDTRITRVSHQIYPLEDLFLYYRSRPRYQQAIFLTLARFLSMCWRPTKRDIYKHLKQLSLRYLVQARQKTLAQALVPRNYAMTNPRLALVFLCCPVRVNRLNDPAAVSRIVLKVRMRKIRGKVGWWRYLLPWLGRLHHMLRPVTSHPTSKNLYSLNRHLPSWATRLRRETHMRKAGVG